MAGYSGDAGDGFMNPGWVANGMMFSTVDSDNDGCGGGVSCPYMHGGGWWWACCSLCDLNHDGALTRWMETGQATDVSISRMLVKII